MSEQVFNSAEDLVKSLEETPVQPAGTTVTVETANSEETVVINVPQQESKPVEAAVSAVPTLKAVEAKSEELRSAVPEAPLLEAQLTEDAEKDKADGKTEEVHNCTLDSMRELVSAANKVTPQVERLNQLLEGLIVDPDKVQILRPDDSNPLALHNQLELVESTTPKNKFPVIALKSGYKAELTALTTNDKIEIRNISGSPLDQTLKLLRFIHGKIVDTSIGKLSFERFLRVTAEDDYETLAYGLYAATFPNATEYTMNCPHCSQEIKLPLYPSQLIEVIDKERAGTYVQEVLSGYNKGEEFLAESMVNRTKRIVLPVSKAIVEIVTPTLHQMVENLKLISEKKRTYNQELIVISKSIDNIAIVDLQSLANGEGLKYIGLPGIGDRLDFLANRIEGEDMKAIRRAVSERVRSYSVRYRIPDFNCPSSACSKPITKVDIDLVNLIFFGIAGEL